MHVGAVLIFDGKIPYVKFVKNLEARLDSLPRYRQKVVFPPFALNHPTWEDDPDFNINNHMTRVKLDKPGNSELLRELANERMSGVLERDKPLWHIHFVEGLENNQTALIIKVHHCMVDGVAGIELAFIMLDVVPDAPPIKKKRFKPKPLPDSQSVLYDALVDNAKDSVENFKRLKIGFSEFGKGFDAASLSQAVMKFGTTMANFLLPFTRMPFNEPLCGDRLVCWKEYQFADARAIRAVCGGTLNDVMLAVLGGAVRAYLRDHGPRKLKYYKSLRVLVPVSIRREDERANFGNRISFLPLEIPLDVADPVERLSVIHLRMQEMKKAKVSDSVGLMFEVIQSLPAPLQSMGLGTLSNPILQTLLGQMASIPPANMICTNVPGPQIPLYAMGKRLRSMHPFVPVCLEMGINCAIVSYDQRIHINLCADAKAGYDVDVLLEYFDQSFHELRVAAEVKSAKYVEIVRTTHGEQA